MRAISSGSDLGANGVGGKSAVEHIAARKFAAAESTGDNSADKSVADDENWFAEAAAALLDQKAGTALHYITGFDERSCQRYAAGTVKPPAYFLRSLLRSDHGWTWLAALMDESKAAWWVDLQYARRVSTALKQLE